MRLYRGCFSAARDEWDMKSNYERGFKPHSLADAATVLYMAVSMFDNRDEVVDRCQRHPRRVGEYVAEVDLHPGLGVCVARVGPTNWSVWGLPDRLTRCVTGIARA